MQMEPECNVADFGCIRIVCGTGNASGHNRELGPVLMVSAQAEKLALCWDGWIH
jgi:hypothetical protein